MNPPAGRSLIWGSFFLALLGNLVVLPGWADFFRPNWLALVLLYWCIYFPERVGLVNGWCWGTASDAAHGTLLGQQGLVFALLGYAMAQGAEPLRHYPLWRQTLVICPLLLLDPLLMTVIDGMSGYLNFSLVALGTALGTALGGAIFWPWVVMLLRELCRWVGLVELQTKEET